MPKLDFNRTCEACGLSYLAALDRCPDCNTRPTVTAAELAFAHSVRYRDGMLHAWLKRTGRGNSYWPHDIPAYIDPPTNDERGRAEVIEFLSRPLGYGRPYFAYLRAEQPGDCSNGFSAPRGVIATWNGEKLAIVTAIRSRREARGYTTDVRGSFWAQGIDGRIYYGRHNGRSMHCTLRLAKNQPE